MRMGHVSVLIPTYNHGRVLAYQLESLLKQTIPPQSIIILDDGSVDETPEMLAKYQGNRTIKVIRQQQNQGLHAGLGVLLSQVDTEFFAFAAADDILARDWCETTASLLEKYADAKMAISNTFIYENGKVSVTDSINFPGRDSEGVCQPAQYLESLTRYGLLPPTNTILYRSDIIGELIRPVMVRKELSSLIDVLLILAIATKYPVAYSTKPTGVFIRNSESYGNSFFGKDQLNDFIAKIELFSVRDGYLCNPAMMFVESWISYTWGKQLILSELAAISKDKKGLKYFPDSCFCYIRLLVLFFAFRRFKFIRFSKRRNPVRGRDLKHFIDGSLFGRFDPA